MFEGARVVPRTAWPASTSSPASARPRQPQGTISTRATEGLAVLGAVAPRLVGQLLAVTADAGLDLLLVALGQPALAAELVLRLDHLGDVVDVVLRLHLRGARRLPVEVLARRAVREDAQQEHEDDEEGEGAPEDHGERVDPVILAPVTPDPPMTRERLGAVGRVRVD